MTLPHTATAIAPSVLEPERFPCHGRITSSVKRETMPRLLSRVPFLNSPFA